MNRRSFVGSVAALLGSTKLRFVSQTSIPLKDHFILKSNKGLFLVPVKSFEEDVAYADVFEIRQNLKVFGCSLCYGGKKYSYVNFKGGARSVNSGDILCINYDTSSST